MFDEIILLQGFYIYSVVIVNVIGAHCDDTVLSTCWQSRDTCVQYES